MHKRAPTVRHDWIHARICSVVLGAQGMADSIRSEVMRQIREEGNGNKISVVITANSAHGVKYNILQLNYNTITFVNVIYIF